MGLEQLVEWRIPFAELWETRKQVWGSKDQELGLDRSVPPHGDWGECPWEIRIREP